ncbi:SymE family type I addiction module toxin [Chitinophaga sp. Hz27]|uniref:Type I addiction module toxin, SymE family n=1 Tax=Chitinophaga silvatica TaxID=2282649 RepID=A0A3E1YHF2_9BACT|nr:type I addiction module toxin, SymE family [Chitinophaga silvatica]
MKSNIRNAKLHTKIVPRLIEPVEVPWLNLSGQWLAKAGFHAGDNISIIVSRNYLRITKLDTQGKGISVNQNDIK